MKTAFLVCEWIYPGSVQEVHLEIIGIFSTKEKAIVECKNSNTFYGEFEIDKACHEKGTEWPTEDSYPIKQ